MKKKVDKNAKIEAERREFNQQYCSFCGHTLMFNPKEEVKICSWCKHKNINNTKARFIYTMNKHLDIKYKEVNLDEKDFKGGKKNENR